MKKTMLTSKTLDKFEANYKTAHYTDAEIEKIELAAYIANMNKNANPDWTEEDIFADFMRILGVDRIPTDPIEAESSMTKSEIIAVNRDKIAEELVEHYRSVLRCDGAIQYKLYIWSDGGLETLEDVQGGSSWLQARQNEPSKLYYITTVDEPCFDPWDYSMDEKPNDEEEQEKEREEIIDWLVGEYKSSIDDVINRIIKEAEEDEQE